MIVNEAQVAAALPGYDLGAKLGAGAFGLVLAGRHRGLNRQVAIKILAAGHDGHDGADAGFAAEAQLLAAMDHPHVVRVYDYVENDDLCLIVMELLGGGTLTRRRAGMSPQAACAVGLAVAAALSCAHSQGVLHRDIKTDNMLFDTAGLLKVTDFGIAKILTGSAATASAIIGTPMYMAPEQITEGRLGPATDLYALGIVLYQLLAGAPPFDPKLPLRALWQHQLDTAPPPLAGVPAPVAAVVLRALAKSSADRQPSAHAFALDLARAAAGVYGRGWIPRSGIVLRLDDDDVRAATEPSARSMPAPPAAPGQTRPDLPPPVASGRSLFVTPLVARAEAAREARGSQGAGAGHPPAAPGRATHHSAAGVHDRLGTSPGRIGASPSLLRSPAQVWPSARRPIWRRRRWWLAAYATAVIGLAVVAIGTAGVSTTRGEPSLAYPIDVAVDKAGNLYIAEQDGYRVRKVDTAGRISTVAGTGTAGFPGDGGLATQAGLDHPYGVAVDAVGDVYITDGDHNRVRKVDTAGRISTVAGTGTAGFSGDGGLATQAGLIYPTGVAVDAAGNLYIADNGNNRVRKVDTAGRISTVAGTGTARFSGDGGLATQTGLHSPYGVAVDAVGDVYIADRDNHRVRKVDTAGRISTVAGTGTAGFSGDGGLATQAGLDHPYGVAVDAVGDVYITDSYNNRVRKVDTAGRISTVAGTGTAGFSGDGGLATQAGLDHPYGVAVDAFGDVYITDSYNDRVRKVDTAGRISTVAK